MVGRAERTRRDDDEENEDNDVGGNDDDATRDGTKNTGSSRRNAGG